MQTKTDGLIIREINVGENDRIVTILTREKGIVRASAKGARSVKGHLASTCRLLCYSSFTLFRGKDKYIISDAESSELFMGVRNDLQKLALAQYFCELCGFLVPEEEPAEMFLRLILNSLQLLQNDKRPIQLIKAAFEMRILTLSGYMPDIVACTVCGTYEDEIQYLYPKTGNICCSKCHKSGETAVALSKGALAALRHLVFADFSKLFAFSLPDKALKELEKASESFLHYRLERSFPTLEFYKNLS